MSIPSVEHESITLDEWCERHADDLRRNVRCTLDVFGIQGEDLDSLDRLIMIHFRDWAVRK